MINRRQAVSWLGAALAGAIGTDGGLARAQTGKGVGKVPRVFPPFELQADRAALDALAGGLKGFAVEDAGGRIAAVWLQGGDGRVWSVGADQRDLEFKFEVFALAVSSLEALRARVAAWEPPRLPEDAPDYLKQLASTRPPMPTPPTRFQPWPFERWQCDVLRRTEFLVEDVAVGPTLGSNPNLQSPAKPGAVPPEASAACEVAVGLLFTGSDGGRLLVGVDWMPYDIVWTQDAALIDAYVEPCEVVSVNDYARRIKAAG